MAIAVVFLTVAAFLQAATAVSPERPAEAAVIVAVEAAAVAAVSQLLVKIYTIDKI